MAQTPKNKSAVKTKPVAKKSATKKPAVKKPAAKKAGAKTTASKAKSAPSARHSTKKPAPPAKKSAGAVAKTNTPSVKKEKATTPAKKAAPKTETKPKAPEAKTNGSKAAKVPEPVVKPEPTKKSGKTPFMPPVSPGKPVPIPKVKRSVLDAAPEIIIKQVYNPKKMPPYYKKQMNRLLELRSALYDTMDGMAKETLRSRPEGSDASVGGMHMGDAGSDAYDRDFALSMLSKEQDALYEINEALGRLERGVYGVCELSGKKIPDERLEALPYTRYTREMQEQIERDNLGGKFRRPVVRSVFGLDDASEEDEDEEGGESPKEAPPQESSLDFMKE
jgi:RNA polymerase-binding transcription factor DksA